MSNDFESHIKT